MQSRQRLQTGSEANRTVERSQLIGLVDKRDRQRQRRTDSSGGSRGRTTLAATQQLFRFAKMDGMRYGEGRSHYSTANTGKTAVRGAAAVLLEPSRRERQHLLSPFTWPPPPEWRVRN